MQGLTVNGYRSGIAAKVKTALKTLAFAASLQTLCLSSAPAGEDALFLSDQRTPQPHRSWQPAWERPRRPSEKNKKQKKKNKKQKKTKSKEQKKKKEQSFFCLFVCKQSAESKANTLGRTAHRKPEHGALRWTQSVAPLFFFFLPVAPRMEKTVGYQLQARRCRVFKCKLHVWKSCTPTSGSE